MLTEKAIEKKWLDMNICNEHTLCSHLSGRITEVGAGFYKLEQVKNSRMVLIGVVYRKSHTDRGLLLNVCPFCEAHLGHINQAVDVGAAIKKAV